MGRIAAQYFSLGIMAIEYLLRIMAIYLMFLASKALRLYIKKNS